MDKKSMMEKLADDAYAKGCFNGTWLYAENGKIISKGARGYRDAENKLPMQEDSIFELASITKQFTASAVMLLVREGKIQLEDEITDYFPEIPYKGVTLRNLLNHMGGVPDIYDSKWIMDIWKKENRIPGNDIILRYLTESGEGPKFAPGEKFEYTNTGYNLLAQVVETVSGIPFEQFLKTRIFEPAGMDSTGVYHLCRDGIPSDQFARNMVLEHGKLVLAVDLKEDNGVAAVDGLNGDDYVYTNIFDMLKWDRVLREGTVVTLEEQKQMYTPGVKADGEIYEDEDGESYGFGWGIQNDPKFGLVVEHSGGMPGLNTEYVRFIDADRVLVVMICRDPLDYRGCMSFWDGMLEVARDNEPDPVTTIEDLTIKNPDKSKWPSFCGRYEKNFEDFPIEEVYMKDDELYARIVWDEDDVSDCLLYPIGENEFGRKNGMVRLRFEEGRMIISDEAVCKKLES